MIVAPHSLRLLRHFSRMRVYRKPSGAPLHTGPGWNKRHNGQAAKMRRNMKFASVLVSIVPSPLSRDKDGRRLATLR